MITDKRPLPDLSHMSYGQMREAILPLDVRVDSAILPDDLHGLYDESRRLILIDRRMTYRRKRCALMHELVHWSHADTACEGVIGVRCERRTRRETAMRLISPTEYASAERVYEGDTWLMACELDVTVQVLEDYRLVLREAVRC